MKTGNIFSGIPDKLPDELFEELVSGGPFRLERIVSKGHVTPENKWYDQDEDEWVLLLEGRARLLFEQGSAAAIEVEMGPGDYILIPARCRHRVVWTAPDQETIWLALHFKRG